MEKLNNESDVSRETSKNEIKIIFKNAKYEEISIHRKEVDELKNALEKTKKYITQLLEIYDKDGFAVIYVNNRLYGLVDVKDLGFWGVQL